MKIKKSALLILIPLLLAVGIAIYGMYFYNQLVSTWNDTTTWTTEERVVLPKLAEGLKVQYTKTKESERRESFKFTADYCYLYKSEYAEDASTVTLSCSLLPMYYAQRQTEVPKDWQEKPDIYVKLNKEDPLPDEYLDRLDSNFDTLFHVATPVPVAISLSGTYIYPEQNLTTLLLHYNTVKAGQKEKLTVEFSDSTFTRLDQPTDEYITAFVDQWKKNLQKEIEEYTATQKLNDKAEIEFLNAADALFSPERLRCQKLETCAFEYDRNPAEKFMYYFYGQKYENTEYYTRAYNAMKTSMLPFNGKPRGTGAGQTCPTCGPNWVELSAYTFPICPVKELFSGKRNENTELFMTYVRDFLSQTIPLPKNSTEALALMKNYETELLGLEGIYDRNIIDGVNVGCYYLLKNGTANNKAVQDRVTFLYYEMLSTLVGSKITPDLKTVRKTIYESVVYSPYKSDFVKDFQVSEYREQGVQESNQAAADYTEWRSMLHTLILFYLVHEN